MKDAYIESPDVPKIEKIKIQLLDYNKDDVPTKLL